MGHYLVQWALGGGTRFNEALWALGDTTNPYVTPSNTINPRGRY